MSQLTVDTPRAWVMGDENHAPVAAAISIFEGSGVGKDGSGNARQLVAGDVFMGFALAKVDNSAGAAGDKQVRLKHRGRLGSVTVTGLAATSVGVAVYMSDGGTFTLTVGANSKIGVVARIVSATQADVDFDAARPLGA
ncbi:MAG: hypothetical protein QOG85_2235 [Gaiellaceae bacterium]|jgi:hypothetical protein|nr:hypothetical protein [Gaiellaceae bacterium]